MTVGSPQAGKLTVTDHLPDDWPYAAEADVPLMATRRWLALTGGWVGSRRRVLATTAAPRCAFHSMLFERPGEPPPPYDLSTLLSSWHLVFDPQAEPGTRPTPGEAIFPNLVVALPGGSCFPVPDLNPDVSGLLPAIDSIIGYARSAGCQALAFLYLWPEAGSTDVALARYGFERFQLENRCDMHVTFADFEGYRAGLRRSRRKQVDRDLRLLADSGIVTELSDLEPVADHILELRCRHRERHGLPRNEAAQRATLAQVATSFFRDIALFCSRHNGQLVRFALALNHAGHWHMLWTGADYDDPYSQLSYFDAVFYSPFRVAPSQGVHEITYGLGAADAKTRRGCQQNPVHGYVLGLTPSAQAAIRKAARLERVRKREDRQAPGRLP